MKMMKLPQVLLIISLFVSTHGKEGAHIPPTISMAEPSILYKEEGEKFSLTCSAWGIPTPSVGWQGINDKVYPKENATSVIKFVNFTKEESGTYQCLASNEHGTVVSGYVEVKMMFLNELKKENITLKATEGDPFEIGCESETGGAVSYPAPTWSWQIRIDEQLLPLDYPRMAVDKDGKLRIAYLNISDGEEGVSFICSAKNAELGKTVSGCETSLTVTKLTGDIPPKKPELSYSNTNKAAFHRVEVIKGEDAILFCIFMGYPDFNITWTKNRNQMPLPKEGITLLEGGTKLIVDSTKHPDDLFLTCTAENSEGTAESLYDVIVREPPVFLPGPKQVKNVNKTVGESVHFRCEVQAEPNAKLVWLSNNVEISAGNTSNPRMVVDSYGNFRLNDLKKTDNQVVTCRVSQSYSPRKTIIFKSGYINVLSPLKITEQPEAYAMVSSFCDVVLLGVHLDYDPTVQPTVTWYRNDKIITEYPQQLYQVANQSLIINATKYCLAEEIAGMYHYVAAVPSLNQSVESIKSNVTLDPYGDFTRGPIEHWALFALDILSPVWLGILIFIIILLFIFLILLCVVCCCCYRRSQLEKAAARKEEDSSDLEVMLQTNRSEELPSKLDAPFIENLYKKYVIIMGDGILTEERVTIMPQAAFHHLITRLWPVLPYLKEDDFETCYQSHCSEGERGLAFRSFHSALNELINTNDARLRDNLPSRRRRNKISDFHTKERVIVMLKIVVDPEKDQFILVNDLKFALRHLDRLNFTNGSIVVTTTTEKVLNGIGYGDFWLPNTAHLTWKLVQLTMQDETSEKQQWICDCGDLHRSFNRQRWYYICALYEVMEFLNFMKRTEMYKKNEGTLNGHDGLRGMLEEHRNHLIKEGVGEPKRHRMQVYRRMADQIHEKFFKRYVSRPKYTV